MYIPHISLLFLFCWTPRNKSETIQTELIRTPERENCY